MLCQEVTMLEIKQLTSKKVVLKLPNFPREAQQAVVGLTQPAIRRAPYEQAVPYMVWNWPFERETYHTEFVVPQKLIPGQPYVAEIAFFKTSQSTKPEDQVRLRNSQLTFKAELSKQELLQLHQMAIKFLHRKPLTFYPCHYIYRNKPEFYWHNVMTASQGIMHKYPKSFGGDRGSPLNGKLLGLFFGVCVNPQTGAPSERSHFGPMRFCMPALRALLHPMGNHLYFADFYCMKKAHYVTLVVTIKGSEDDMFCARRLPRIDIFSNSFWFVDSRPLQAMVTDNVWIEVIVTESINVAKAIYSDCFFKTVHSTGVSSLWGIPKNPECTICNLPDI